MDWLGVVDAANITGVRSRLGEGKRTVGRGRGGLVALRVESPSPGAEDVLSRLREPGWWGLVFGGDVAEVTAVAIGDGDTVMIGLLPLEPAAVRAVLEWAAAHVPKFGGGRRSKVATILAAWAGMETAEELLVALGFSLARPDPWLLLGGAILPPHGSKPRFIGEVEVDWETFRYELSTGDGFVGIWDWAAPEQPVERWPADPAGNSASLARWNELALVPPLTGQRLDGRVLWQVCHRPDAPEDPRIQFIHEGPGAMFFRFGAGPLPRSAAWVPAGSQISNGMHSKIVVHNLDDMARATNEDQAWLLAPVTDWQPLPDDAPRGLLALNDWLLARARM